jgi:type VI secretion system secreted protein VgrG
MLYQLQADFLPVPARVVWFDGDEALHRPYRFRVVFYVPSADALTLDLDSATGERARLEVRDAEGAARFVHHGTVASLELLDDAGRFTVFAVELVPKLWQLGLGEHSRVFVDKTLPEILEETLKQGGLAPADYELRLGGSYPVLSHVCQYRESRLAFVARWLERVGAHYFFEHGSDHEKVILSDAPNGATCRAEPVRFVASAAGDTSAHEALRTFRWKHAVLPKKVVVADYSYLKPTLDVSGEADVVPDDAGGDVVLFDLNEDLPEKAKAQAQARALQQLAARTTYQAHGRVLGLVPGWVFELEEHPRADLCKKYSLTRVRHRGYESIQGDLAELDDGGPLTPPWAADDDFDPREVYRCEIEAVDADVRWVAAPGHAWPRVAGTVRARVDGPSDSEYAQLDEHGRYLVRLLFDESGLPDGGASTRIRMLQPHAGNPEGLHFPLRKGTEVQVAFLRGDPDQPVIHGVVPNKVTQSPVTEANHTHNVVQTGGLNRTEMEDQQGSEYIDLSTPPQSTFAHLGAHAGLGSHNYVFSTDGDYAMHTGGDRDITVGGEQSETVQGNVVEDYHADQTTHVMGSLTETIDSGSTQTIHAGSTQTIDGGVTQSISGGETRVVEPSQTETIQGGRTQTITGSSSETIGGSLAQTVSGAIDITHSGGHSLVAAGGFNFITPSSIRIVCTGGFNLLAPGGQTRLDEEYDSEGGSWLTNAPNQLTLILRRVDYRALYGELVTVKIDCFGVKRTQGTRQLTIAGHIFDVGGALAKVGGLFKRKAAVQAEGG